MKDNSHAFHHLLHPGKDSLENVYRSMGKLEELFVSVRPDAVHHTLKDLEETGFAGIFIEPHSEENDLVNIRAIKGKHGPCFDTGKMASYKGNAIAVMDDDNHLLISGEKLPVCEKTARLLSGKMYEQVVSIISPGDKKTSKKPEYFNCDTLEEDQEKLFAMLRDRKKEADRVPMVYPGPFRYLILRDGTLVRRGIVSGIPGSMAAGLSISDRMFKSSGSEVNEVFFQDLYRQKGPGWMVTEFRISKSAGRAVPADFRSLANCSPGMKKRLLTMIREGREYFILTGSDPADPDGCCPSEEVSEANRLVGSGVLESYSQESRADACPVTVYAFRGEIRSMDGEVEFIPDHHSRKSAMNILQKASVVRSLIKWTLLAFIVVSVIVGIYRLGKWYAYGEQKPLRELLAPEMDNRLLVLLFHYHNRCLQCTNMENFTKELISEQFRKQTANRQVAFRMIDMDDPVNRQLMKKFSFLTATIVLVDVTGEGADVKIIEEGWENFNNEAKFKSLLEQEINLALNTENE